MTTQQRFTNVLARRCGLIWFLACQVGWVGSVWAIPANKAKDAEQTKAVTPSSAKSGQHIQPKGAVVTGQLLSPSSKTSKKLPQVRAKVSELGPPPPPADNEIPPAPPAFRPYQRPTKKAPARPAQSNSWYHSPEYQLWLKRRRAQQRKRRRSFRKNPHRVQFWWSSEMGLYLGSFSPIGGDSRSLDFMGLMSGGQVGLRYRSLILSVGAYFAFSLKDGKDPSDSFVGGSVVRLSGSLGWALGRFMVLESGMSMEYMQLKQNSLQSGALLFPAHFGVTLRLPLGAKYALGIRTLLSVAFDAATEGFHFSVTSNLVFQTF